MKRLIWLPIAGFLLIAGAAAAVAAPTDINTRTAALNVPGAAGSLLAEVLGELVNDGTITQQQSDAITDALETRIEEKRAEAEQRWEEMRAAHEQLRGFLEDEVLTREEVEQLPADHPLRSLETALDDGHITLDELRELRGAFPGFGHGRGPGLKEGWGHGPRGSWHHWIAPDAADPETDLDSDAQTDPDSGADQPAT